eukprot:CAMPEP_0118936918 /NCGR_PEP_ID=MMETSP1169-20130426/21079_1 /TAXON_ID=36882 /ORGANISM="Pyramimonas obovata, Strain CCMP722" /LENGTH=47 /DNA_ID= /DNA_START= /DNA_END= /DNA_ORIENTATION=
MSRARGELKAAPTLVVPCGRMERMKAPHPHATAVVVRVVLRRQRLGG